MPGRAGFIDISLAHPAKRSRTGRRPVREPFYGLISLNGLSAACSIRLTLCPAVTHPPPGPRNRLGFFTFPPFASALRHLRCIIASIVQRQSFDAEYVRRLIHSDP